MIMQRRAALIGLGSLLVAPSIVRASSLMPISTRLMRFSKADAVLPFCYFTLKFNPDEFVQVVAAKRSPLNDREMLLMKATGSVITVPASDTFDDFVRLYGQRELETANVRSSPFWCKMIYDHAVTGIMNPFTGDLKL